MQQLHEPSSYSSAENRALTGVRVAPLRPPLTTPHQIRPSVEPSQACEHDGRETAHRRRRQRRRRFLHGFFGGANESTRFQVSGHIFGPRDRSPGLQRPLLHRQRRRFVSVRVGMCFKQNTEVAHRERMTARTRCERC